MKKLHEIISKEAKKFASPVTPEGFNLLIQNVAIEFAKHILEEAAENATTIDVYKTRWSGLNKESYIEKDVYKQSITDTLNKYL